VTRTCVNLIVSEYFDIICSQKFKVPPVDDIREWVVEEWNRRVDDQLAEAVEKEYPDLSEEELDEKVSMIERLYQKEYEHRVDAATRAVFRELKSRVLSLQKDVIDLKKKYTS
jgi:disulfide oxidoreductase YuzD